ncbi:MAG: hypothetical protein ACRC8S_09645 [Fimbriiglobus sp.]
MKAVSFPFRTIPSPFPTRRPILPIRLTVGAVSLDVEALVDSGADVNILPYDLGLQLGLSWSQAIGLPPVGGALSSSATRAALVTGEVIPFPAVRLGFVWVQANNTPVILGITNFFLEFDVSFFASQNEFTIVPRSP